MSVFSQQIDVQQNIRRNFNSKTYSLSATEKDLKLTN